jgi:hypothetical protein
MAAVIRDRYRVRNSLVTELPVDPVDNRPGVAVDDRTDQPGSPNLGPDRVD